MTELNRRSLITGLISLVAAPAIVRVSSIMPVHTMFPPEEWDEGGTWSLVRLNEQWINPKHVLITFRLVTPRGDYGQYRIIDESRIIDE